MAQSKTIRGHIASKPERASRKNGQQGICFRLFEYGTRFPLTHFVNVFLAQDPEAFNPIVGVREGQVLQVEGFYRERPTKKGTIERYIESPLGSLQVHGRSEWQEPLENNHSNGGGRDGT